MQPETALSELKTERLVLRPVRTADAARIAELIGNWNVIRWLAMPPYPYQLKDAEDFITRTLNREPTGEICSLAITCDEALIGHVGYGGPRDSSKVLIGYWLGEPYWGKGYMSEALDASLAHYFATTDADEIFSGILTGNSASLRIQEKLGFEVIGESEIFCVPRGETLAHLDTRLSRQRYEDRRQ